MRAGVSLRLLTAAVLSATVFTIAPGQESVATPATPTQTSAVVTLPAPVGIQPAKGVVMADGGLVTALALASSVELVKVRPDLALDPAFGSGGVVTVEVGGSVVSVDAVVLDAEGRIVVAVSTTAAPSLVRFSASGQRDTTFSGALPVVPGSSFIGLTPDAAGGGYVTEAAPGSGTVVHLLASGAPDPAFGDNGTITTPSSPAVAVLSSGIAVAGASSGSSSVLDVFDAQGVPVSSHPLMPYAGTPTWIAPEAGGFLITASGVPRPDFCCNPLTGRYLADGTLDHSFGAGPCGQLIPGGSFLPNSAPLPNGGWYTPIVASGSYGSSGIGVEVYDASGRPDERAGPGGLLPLDPSQATITATSGVFYAAVAFDTTLRVRRATIPEPTQGRTGDSPNGVVIAASDGGVFTAYTYGTGNGVFCGSTGNLRLNRPIIGTAEVPDRYGYWLVASDGGIFSFGDATFFGSTGAIRLNQPIVGMAATPDGGGYWLVASDGGIFSFGDATFFGSTGAMQLNQPIVGMAATPDGGGYWLVASDGGIFSFGDATFFGSTGNLRLNQPIVGMVRTDAGQGYWLGAADGGVFNFGDAGAPHDYGYAWRAPVVGISRVVSGGYALADRAGDVCALLPVAMPGTVGSVNVGSCRPPQIPLAHPGVAVAAS